MFPSLLFSDFMIHVAEWSKNHPLLWIRAIQMITAEKQNLMLINSQSSPIALLYVATFIYAIFDVYS